MPHFIFIRHGESQLNVANRQARVFCGQTETPLTHRGREQARTTGRVLAAWTDLRISVAVSSALSRCRETMDLILLELPYPVERLPDSHSLKERSLGDFDGCLAEEVYARHPQFLSAPELNRFDNDFIQKAPGGENLRDVTARAWAAVQKLHRCYAGNVLIVSHHTTIRCILGQALGLPDETVRRMRVPNAVPLVVQREPAFRLVDGLEVLEI